MTQAIDCAAKDWVSSARSYALTWGAPSLAVVAGALVNPPFRTVIWTVALVWMGAACLINARRCGRTHCRFTWPFYLVLTIPVLFHGFGLFPLGPYTWWELGAVILGGGKIISWITESAWSKYSTPA